MIKPVRTLPGRAGRAGYVLAREALARRPGIYIPYGIPVRADARADYALRYALARGGPREAPQIGLIQRHLSADCDVIELGARIGIVSATIRANIGAHARHLLVEADPDCAALAWENAQGPMPERTELVCAAFGDAGCTLPDLVAKLPARYALICDMAGAELALIAVEADGPALARCDLLVLATDPRRYPNGLADADAITTRLADIGLEAVERAGDAIAYSRAAAS